MSRTAARNGAALLAQARLRPTAGVHRLIQRNNADLFGPPGGGLVESPRICLAHISSNLSPPRQPGLVVQRYVCAAGLWSKLYSALWPRSSVWAVCSMALHLHFTLYRSTKRVTWVTSRLILTEREPSPARSAVKPARSVENLWLSSRDRDRCEPGTAHAPAAVSKCGQWEPQSARLSSGRSWISSKATSNWHRLKAPRQLS